MELFRYDGNDPRGADGLNEFVRVAMEMERWRAIRGALSEWLVWMGLPLWVAASRPGLLPQGVHRLVLALWGMVTVFFLYAVGKEWTYRRRKGRYRVDGRRIE
jgi:hypothetical protein